MTYARPYGGSELDGIEELLADLDKLAGTPPHKHRRGLWDCTIAAWAAAASENC